MDAQAKALCAFGTELRERELSQERLPELGRMNRNYVSDVERGRRNPCLWNIVRLADALRLFRPSTGSGSDSRRAPNVTKKKS